jgi:3-dehydroquinate synthase
VSIERLEVELGARSYPISIGPNLLRATRLFEDCVPGKDLLIVTNDRVGPLYLEVLLEALASRRTAVVTLPDGEEFKTLASVERIIDALVAERMNRDCAVLALGGGVVGDIAGFAAACYQRGVAYVQLPTTLLAQVDSSVGGKTGVNHAGGKNLIGAFHQPRAVIADIETLHTLPPREYAAGLAEVVKYGLIHDAGFFGWLEINAAALMTREPHALMRAIRRCCEIKATIVSADERETGLRAVLNFGHTFGHAIETATGYGAWLHGEAVSAGMVMAAELSSRLGWLDRGVAERARRLLARFGLPVSAAGIGASRALDLMGMDKKVERGRLRLVLLRGLGEAVVTADYPQALLMSVLEQEMG